ncbi:MAG: hypothetical protein WC829_08750 [Hyphomicrobium sp.]
MVRLTALVLSCLALTASARAESFLTLDPSEYPAAVNTALQQVRSGCRDEGHQPLDYPQAGVTVLDLNGDGSKDIFLQAWQACDFPTKGAGCNTAGCVVQIFKQVGNRQWRMIFDETLDPQFFLSASEAGHFNLMAASVSRKISDRCPDPSGSVCDYLLHWKRNKFVWERIR